MTKKQYLAKLRKYLLFRLTNSEINDISADIEECFEAGAADGKSEEEICLSLGEPKAAAASLLNEQTGGERISKLAEIWLPLVISVVLYAAYTYCGYHSSTDNYNSYVMPIMCVLPLMMWVLFERRGFFTALSDYKCDFLTLAGSLLMLAAGAAFNEIPKRSLVDKYSDPESYIVMTAVFVSLAMITLAVSLWRNAPKIFSVLPLAGIFFIIQESLRLYRGYHSWNGNQREIYVTDMGMGTLNVMCVIFICATAFLIWSFIRRNALTLASAYASVTLTGFIFYYEYNLSALDPSSPMTYFLKYVVNGSNYLIGGAAAAAAVTVFVVIIKLAKLIKRKRGG